MMQKKLLKQAEQELETIKVKAEDDLDEARNDFIGQLNMAIKLLGRVGFDIDMDFLKECREEATETEDVEEFKEIVDKAKEEFIGDL